MQNTCLKCSNPLTPGMQFCLSCGAPATPETVTMAVCPNCQNHITQGARNCAYCAYDLTSSLSGAPYVQPPAVKSAGKGWLIATIVLAVLLFIGVIFGAFYYQKYERERRDNERYQKELEEVKTQRDKLQADKQRVEDDLKNAQTKAAKDKQDAENEAARNAHLGQVKEQLDTAGGYYLSMGFSKINYYPGSLPTGGSETFSLTFVSGQQYKLISVCDNGCADIDIYVYGPSGDLIASDAARDDHAELTLNATANGQATVKVTMYKCNQGPCVYGIGAFSRTP